LGPGLGYQYLAFDKPTSSSFKSSASRTFLNQNPRHRALRLQTLASGQ
jgi:hypothetical protein